MNKINEIILLFNKNKKLELELRLHDIDEITYNMFLDNHLFKKVSEIKNESCIKSINKLTKYRRLTNKEKTTVIKKKSISYTFIDKYKLALSEELPTGYKIENKNCEIIRQRDRKSMFCKLYPKWIFDFTIIDNNKYEIEIEYNSQTNISYSDIINVIEFMKNINYIEILSKYFGKQIRSIMDIINQPANLEFNDLQKIYSNYSVTEKADGLRSLLLIDNYNNLYSVSKPLKINFLKEIKGNNELYLLDSENVNDKYLIFDILIDKSKNITGNTFLERLDLLENIVNKIKSKNIFIKNIKYGKDMCKISEEVYNRKYSYDIDGLIYIPNKENYYGKIYKWKPRDKLTIDFLIKIDKKYNVPNRKKIILFVNIKKYLFENLGLNLPPNYSTLFPMIDLKSSIIFPIPFYPYETAIIEVKGDIYKDKIPILDDTIIEFKYDEKIKNREKRWIPYRYRSDKTEEYKVNLRKGIYTGGPNAWLTAKGTMNMINNPITEDILFCKQKGGMGENEIIRMGNGYIIRHGRYIYIINIRNRKRIENILTKEGYKIIKNRNI